jgi:hypothetical protein
MKKANTIFVSAFSLILVICASSAIAQDIVVKVTDPPRNGIEVRRTYKVMGTASIPSGTHLWVLTRREDFEGLWWPQSEGKVDPVSKKWKVSVTFGIPDDIGWNFDIAAIVIAESQHAILRNYRIKAMKTGDWRPIEMPEVLAPPILLRVKKVGH